MLDDINKVWRDIEAIAFIKQHGCWNDCGGGRCCSNNIPELDFKFIHKNGTNIIYMDGEWNYLSHHGLVPSSSIQTHSLDFGGPQPLRIHQARCSLLGLCEGKLSKPLLCRTYPYVPQMDEAGNLLGLLPGSIFDLTAQTFGFDLPCSVSKGRQQTLEDWRGDAVYHGHLHSPPTCISPCWWRVPLLNVTFPACPTKIGWRVCRVPRSGGHGKCCTCVENSSMFPF